MTSKNTGNTKWTGFLQQLEYRSQRPDAEGLQRFNKEIGKTTNSDGKSNWTNFKVYTQEPSLDHPLNIKLSLQNPAGKAFTQLTITEFDELLTELVDWRISQSNIYDTLLLKERKLAIRRQVFERIHTLLSHEETDLPDLQMKGKSIYDETVLSLKDKLYKAIDQLRFSENDRQRHSLKSYIYKLIEILPEETDRKQIIEYMKEKLNSVG